MIPVYRCTLLDIVKTPTAARLRIAVGHDHPQGPGTVLTSEVKTIDFGGRLAVTQNSIYIWAPQR